MSATSDNATLKAWHDRDKQFDMLLFPRIMYDIQADFTLREIRVTSFAINPGCTAPVCNCIDPDGRKFQCSSDMLHVTPEEAKLESVEDLKSNIDESQKFVAEQLRLIIEASAHLRRLEKELEAIYG